MSASKLLNWFLLFILIFTVGCAPKKDSLTTPYYYTQQQVNALFLTEYKILPTTADKSYQEVNRAALSRHYEKFRDELFNKGVLKWNSDFDCNQFSLAYHSFSQITYNSERKTGQSIAIGEVYYLKNGLTGHAVNFAIVDRGVIFIEPQTGLEIKLTDIERQSIFFVKI